MIVLTAEVYKCASLRGRPPLSTISIMSEVKDSIAKTTDDRALLASLGYKQELKREFTAVQLFGFGFSVSAIVPSVA